MGEWEPITDLPPTRLYVDQWGNVRRRSTKTGRFISGTIQPDFGQLGYGDTIELEARRTERDDD